MLSRKVWRYFFPEARSAVSMVKRVEKMLASLAPYLVVVIAGVGLFMRARVPRGVCINVQRVTRTRCARRWSSSSRRRSWSLLGGSVERDANE